MTVNLGIDSRAARPLFFVRRGDRLAARLKHILYTWRFSNAVGGKAFACWLPRDHSVYNSLAPEYYSAHLIWDIVSFYIEGGHDELTFVDGAIPDQPLTASLKEAQFADFRPNKFKREMFTLNSSIYFSDSFFYFLEDENRKDADDAVRKLFKRLPLSVTMRGLMEQAYGAIGTDKYAALHVRRGDIPGVLRASLDELESGSVKDLTLKYANHAAKQTAPFHFYYSSVEKCLSEGKKIIFFSDTPDTYHVFSTRYGRDMVLDGSSLGADAKYPLQKAFLDFSLLGNAHELIGTQTGFASLAALLGGAKHTVVTARGSRDEFEQYFFDEILMGRRLTGEVKKKLQSAYEAEYDRYHAAAVKRGFAL